MVYLISRHRNIICRYLRELKRAIRGVLGKLSLPKLRWIFMEVSILLFHDLFIFKIKLLTVNTNSIIWKKLNNNNQIYINWSRTFLRLVPTRTFCH